MEHYEKLKTEIVGIAEILKSYPETLQGKVFDILVNEYLGRIGPRHAARPPASDVPVTHEGNGNGEKVEPAPKAEPSKRRSASKESFQIAKDLNLGAADGKPAFTEFVKSKGPSSNIEFNAVAVYYLDRVRGINPITINHVYTCYKNVGRKLPGNLTQSLYDTSGGRYGYIDVKSLDDLRLPTSGENFVEHTLPKAPKA